MAWSPTTATASAGPRFAAGSALVYGSRAIWTPTTGHLEGDEGSSRGEQARAHQAGRRLTATRMEATTSPLRVNLVPCKRYQSLHGGPGKDGRARRDAAAVAV